MAKQSMLFFKQCVRDISTKGDTVIGRRQVSLTGLNVLLVISGSELA
jgi:hypothetical protein